MNTNLASESLFFKGRAGDPRLGEWAQQRTLESIKPSKKPTFALLGSPDDQGVILNRGRPGASGGPDAVRGAFYKFAHPHHPNFSLWDWIDAGNIQIHKDILETHREAFEASQKIAASGATLIAIGGGHDFAAPHILGAFEGLNDAKKAKSFGVINVDPHLDVRPLENGLPNSGTAFRQILESKRVKGPHLVQFGARSGRNSSEHFKYCKQQKVAVHEFSLIKKKASPIPLFKSALTKLSKTTDAIALTIDMDCCEGIEGVSAAPVLGFSVWELCQFAELAGANPKVKVLELAEIAPNLDPSGRAARIAAEVLFHFLIGRLKSKT